jgi:3-methyladenine DNA glycosylase AlkD
MSVGLVEEIRAKIRENASPEHAVKVRRYFREPIETHGLTSQAEKEITNHFYPRIKGDLHATIQIANELVRSRIMDEVSIGIRLVKRFSRHLTPEHFDVFDGWVDDITNWANTDSLCTWLIAETVRADPALWSRLLEWTESKNRWRRRASAVSLVPIARKGDMLEEAFTIADRLMRDSDDMVQKGVGWLLKEASKEHPEEVREFLLRWRSDAPSLILRYASEKLLPEKRVLKTR